MELQRMEEVRFDAKRLRNLREATSKLSEELCHDRSLRWSLVPPQTCTFTKHYGEKQLADVDLKMLNRLRYAGTVHNQKEESLHQSLIQISSLKNEANMTDGRGSRQSPGLNSFISEKPLVLDALIELSKSITMKSELPDTPRSYRRLSVPDIIMTSMDWDDDDVSTSDASGETLLHLGHLMEGRRWSRTYDGCASASHDNEVGNPGLGFGRILIVFGFVLATCPFLCCSLRPIFELRSDIMNKVVVIDLSPTLVDEKLLSNSLVETHNTRSNLSRIPSSFSRSLCTPKCVENATLTWVEHSLFVPLESPTESSTSVSLHVVSLNNLEFHLIPQRRNQQLPLLGSTAAAHETLNEISLESKALIVYRRFDSDTQVDDSTASKHPGAVRAKFWGGAFARPLSPLPSSRYSFLREKYLNCDVTTARFNAAMTFDRKDAKDALLRIRNRAEIP